LAHANGFPPETYREALEPLLSRYHVVSLLARPLWGTTPPEWLKSWSQLADDLREGLKTLGVRQVVGVGHSLGGVTTLYAAIAQPELFSKIVLIDPTMLSPKLLWQIKFMKLFGLEARSYLIKGALRRKRTWESADDVYEYFRSRLLFKGWTDGTVKAYVQSMTAPSPTGGVYLIYPPEWEARIYKTIPTNVWKFVEKITQPILLVRGENSNTFTSDSEKAFRRAAPQTAFEVIPGAGHLVPQEKPKELGQVLAGFLKG
jgi:pimeloyl-ACP methyl ester carboxylesterase